jgi:hypothetical protein
LPLSFAADFPDPYANLSADERENRTLIGTDQCIIDNEQFYLRGCLEIPLRESDEVFLWGLWARVHKEDFDEISKYWEVESREKLIGPYKARLANSLSIYPETLSLKIEVRIQEVGVRPLFVTKETHLLTEEQAHGITREQAQKYACTLMRAAAY